ncbi:hypothetical protein MXB_4806, partial [Myxobolus squamalis]
MDHIYVIKFLSIFSLIVFIIDIAFNFAASTRGPWSKYVFNNNTVAESSAFVNSSIKPSTWIFSIWGVIYLYQFIWISITIFLAFSKNTSIIPIGSFVGFVFTCIFNLTWLITYSFHLITVSLIVITFFLLSIGFSAYWGSIFPGKNI